MGASQHGWYQGTRSDTYVYTHIHICIYVYRDFLGVFLGTIRGCFKIIPNIAELF